ncbi:MAG: RNA 2',3'-cyclic phosphodiesterase [Planctomycetaceae bacterium]
MEKPSPLIRAFIGIAIRVSPSLRKLLRDFELLGNGIKIVSEQNLHVTLKFLGDVSEEQIAKVDRLLAEIVPRYRSHRISLARVGAFPHVQRPSVVWIGMQPAELLIALAEEIERESRLIGFEPEQRAFSPHLTIGRVKFRPPQKLFDLMRKHEQTVFGDVEIDEVRLYSSELTPQGPKYAVLKEYPLEPV